MLPSVLQPIISEGALNKSPFRWRKAFLRNARSNKANYTVWKNKNVVWENLRNLVKRFESYFPHAQCPRKVTFVAARALTPRVVHRLPSADGSEL
jgi:hypothetical protein